MKDGLGQDIQTGDKVVWVGGKERYSGVSVHTVMSMTAKRVKITPGTGNYTFDDVGQKQYVGSNIEPDALVVVNKLLDTNANGEQQSS